ncbi:MAG: hypothetical protein ABI885_13965 [Gammaproteobacteria bacterium]
MSMRTVAQAELLALSERWRSRARSFMADAEAATNSRDVIRLAAMAVTLEVAARDLEPLVTACIDVPEKEAGS